MLTVTVVSGSVLTGAVEGGSVLTGAVEGGSVLTGAVVGGTVLTEEAGSDGVPLTKGTLVSVNQTQKRLAVKQNRTKQKCNNNKCM